MKRTTHGAATFAPVGTASVHGTVRFASNEKMAPDTMGSGTSVQELKKMRAEARQQAARGNFTVALELMARVVGMQAPSPPTDYADCALYAWNMGRYQDSRVYCEQSLQKNGRTANELYYLVVICTKLRDYDAALAAGHELLELGEKTPRVYAAIAYASMCVKNFEDSMHYGELALAAWDASIPAVSPTEFPRRKDFDPAKKTRNIISFSLWGQDNRYLRGAVRNALLAHDFYPSWTCRFYLDESVPGDVTALLRALQAQVILMPRPSLPFEGLGWRFQVWDDKNVDFCLIRDCDSVFSSFETVAVNAWLRSERWFHVMRGWYGHTDLILAGLWGGATGMLNNLYTGYTQSLDSSMTSGADQIYLRKYVWPVIKQNATIHDRVHRIPGTLPFPDADLWPGGGWHVGSNEAAGNPGRQELLLREYYKRCPSLRGRTGILRANDAVQTVAVRQK